MLAVLAGIDELERWQTWNFETRGQYDAECALLNSHAVRELTSNIDNHSPSTCRVAWFCLLPSRVSFASEAREAHTSYTQCQVILCVSLPHEWSYY